MGKYKLINNVLGWVVFLIASTVYLMTMEPTASFWDCGEFISSAYKLEVGHPPGAPFFMLTANLFTQFASDPSKVAVMVNTMSALFSGLTILFLFWSITHLARKIIVEDDKMMCLGQMITIMGCGLVGSLADFEQYEQCLESITPATLREAFNSYLSLENYSLLYLSKNKLKNDTKNN